MFPAQGSYLPCGLAFITAAQKAVNFFRAAIKNRTGIAKLWKNRFATMAFAVLKDAKGLLVSRNRLFEPLFKEMKWRKPEISVTVKDGVAAFKSETFAWGVCLDLDGRKLPDNFFDLYPGQEYRLPWKGGRPPVVKFTGNLK